MNLPTRTTSDMDIEERMKLYRKAMRLREEKGWGKRRIAREINISEDVVKGWLYYGYRPDGWERYIEIEPSPALSYVIGVFWGDGWINHDETRGYVIGLTATDSDFVEEFNRQLCSVLDKEKLYALIDQKNGKQKKVSGSSKQLYDFLDGSLESQKEYIEEYPTDFLRGFFDSEGGANQSGYDKRVYCYNTNKTLLEYVKKLLDDLGISSNICQIYKSGSVGTIEGRDLVRTKDGYQLLIRSSDNIRKFKQTVGFSIRRKQEALNNLLG